MSDHIPGFDRDQVVLFPNTLDRYIDEENPVRFIDAFVNSLDLKELGFKKVEPSEMGRPSYDPYDMLKLYVYGYLNQVRSSRKLERECQRNVEVMWLMKKLAPDFKTIADFRKDSIDCIKPVFKEFVFLCKSLDLFGGELIGIDGSKFRAVNSKEKNFTREKLIDRLKWINEKIENYLKEMDENDENEKEGSSSASNEGHIKDLTEKTKKLAERKSEYEGLMARMEATGVEESSLTDPDSRLMVTGKGKLDVCYNVQTAVDSKNKLVPDYDVTNDPLDGKMLSHMAKGAKETLGVEKIDVTADTGYHDAGEIKECVDNGITPYVSESETKGRWRSIKLGVPEPEFYDTMFVHDRAIDVCICPAGQRLKLWSSYVRHEERYSVYRTEACFSCPLMVRCTKNKHGRVIIRWEHQEIIDEMRKRMKREPSKFEARKELCEHPFGTMKRAFNQGYFLMKGLRKVKGEMGFTMLAYNMRRAINMLGTKALLASLNTQRMKNRR